VSPKKTLLLFLLAASILLPSSPSRAAPERVFKKILDNGLTVLVSERRPCGLISIHLNLKCGSSMEGEYLGTGISHLVEHMVYKGTMTRAAGQVEKEAKACGASISGATSYDKSSFSATVRPEFFPRILELLKDMMENASFDAEELKKEKEVILKEMNLQRDDPERSLFKLLWENAYTEHPYKYPTIGYEGPFNRLKRGDLLKYYNRMYVPNKMVLAITGDIDKDIAMEAAEEVFGDLTRTNYGDTRVRQEPLQLARRELDKPFASNLAYVAMGYHSTSLLDEDLFSMDVLAMILGQGDNSRLNEKLFKKEGLVHAISAYNYTPKDKGLFFITAISDPEDADRIEGSVKEAIDGLKKKPVLEEELERARNTVLASYLSSRQTSEGLAEDIADNELMTGSYAFSDRYIEGVKDVTGEDIMAAADKFLKDDNLTIVRLHPKGAIKKANETDDKVYSKPAIIKETLPNGIRVIVSESDKIPMVALTIGCLGGLRSEDAKTNGISNLVSRLLLKGTSKRSEGDIAGSVERLGGHLSPFSGFNSFGLGLTCFKQDLDRSLDLLSEVMTDSVFPEAQIEKEKTLAVAAIKGEDDDIFLKGELAFRKALFKDQPYGMRAAGEQDTINALSRGDIIDYYKRWVVADNLVISVSGDVDGRDAVERIRARFSGIKGGQPPRTGLAESRFGHPGEEVAFDMDKEESLIIKGYGTVPVSSPDRYPLVVLASMLSGGNGRLFSGIRDKLGLAYAVGCYGAFLADSGYFILYAATTRDRLPMARKELSDQMTALRSKGIAADELESAKRELITTNLSRLETNEFVSLQCLLDELYGLGADNIYRYGERIERVTRDDIARVVKKYFGPKEGVEVLINKNK